MKNQIKMARKTELMDQLREIVEKNISLPSDQLSDEHSAAGILYVLLNKGHGKTVKNMLSSLIPLTDELNEAESKIEEVKELVAGCFTESIVDGFSSKVDLNEEAITKVELIGNLLF